MKAIGLDLGNRSLGVAISDSMKMLARPLKTFTIPNQDLSYAVSCVKTLLETEEIDTIIVGHPKNMDNTEGTQAMLSSDFSRLLEEATSCNVILQDERLTTKMASNMMKQQKLNRTKRKQAIDEMAASIILQTYLDQSN